MKKRLLSIFGFFVILSSCGPTIYKAQDFSDKTSTHKIVAILPAEVSIQLRPNELKNTTPEQIKKMEKQTGETIQDKMYTWFLKRSDKFKYTVSFQDISKTNAILAKNNLTEEILKSKTKDEIAKLLEVDAVLTTKASMKKPMSDGAAVAVGVLFGAWGSTNNVLTSITINEATKGDLIWKYDYTAAGSVGSNTDNLVNALMRNASKKFPYNAKK